MELKKDETLTNERIRFERVGCVVIGKNEGEKLLRGLKSISPYCKVVYVDSGSVDQSTKRVADIGVDVIKLDMTQPFTAGRARNSGAEQLLLEYPSIEYIQFLDGDCELEIDWLQHAVELLDLNQEYAVVCGQLHERFPEHSVYNWLCQIEWNTPVGDVSTCGGVALIRSSAFKDIGGFKANLIAGEEPEMCFRLRHGGWKIKKISQSMAYHDAEIYEFSQWWKRRVRCGYAFAEGASLHGNSEERYWVRDTQRILLWGIVVPITILIASTCSPLFLFLLLIYPIQWIRVANKNTDLSNKRYVWSFFIMLGKFPEAIGLLRFNLNNFRRSP